MLATSACVIAQSWLVSRVRKCLGGLALGNGCDGVEQLDELRAALLAAQDVAVLERQRYQIGQDRQEWQQFGDRCCAERMAGRPHGVGFGQIDHREHTHHSCPGAHRHRCDRQHGFWRQIVAPGVERGKARVGARVDDRDRTTAPRDPALHTFVWRKEHRLCGYARAGCRESQGRPRRLGQEERRLMNLQQITGALHDQVKCHF